MENSEETPGEVLIHLNECLVNLQLILKCSICCSTLRDPVTPSCNHAFCKECLESVFQRRYSIECPVCRQKITKRSARTPSEHVSGLVALYIQLVQCFKADIKDSNPIPKEKFILESQALTQAADCPLKEINLKIPEHNISKKRKNQDELPNRQKIGRYAQDDDNFVVSSHVKNEFKENINKNKKNNYETTGNVMTMPSMPSVEEEKAAKLPLFKIPVYTEKKPSSFGTRSVNEAKSIVFKDVPDLDEAIRQKKLLDPECNDIQAFFTLFPTAHIFFKKNLTDILHQLGVELPKLVEHSDATCQADKYTESLQISACQTEENVKDVRVIGCQTNESRIHGFQTIACQTEEIRRELKTTTCQTCSKNVQTTACQTEENIVTEEDVVPASEPEIQHKVEVACQTDDLNIKNGSCISHSANVRETIDDSEQIVPPSDTPTAVDINIGCVITSQRLSTLLPSTATEFQSPQVNSDETSRESRVFSLPPKPIIVVSRRQSVNDNDLLNRFKYKFGNVQIRTEFTNNATHLVMMNMRDNSPVKERSLIYVQSIIHRLEILSRNWIDDCLRSGTLLNTNSYRIEIFDYLPWFVEKSNIPGLFAGILFYLPYRFFSASDPIKREQIMQLIIGSGGHTTSNADDIVKASSRISSGLKFTSKITACLVVFSSFSKEADSARRVSHDLKTSVVSADYILDCICENHLLPKEKYFIKL